MQKGQYFLIDMIFDGADSDGDYFQYITVYDNRLRRERKKQHKKEKIK